MSKLWDQVLQNEGVSLVPSQISFDVVQAATQRKERVQQGRKDIASPKTHSPVSDRKHVASKIERMLHSRVSVDASNSPYAIRELAARLEEMAFDSSAAKDAYLEQVQSTVSSIFFPYEPSFPTVNAAFAPFVKRDKLALTQVQESLQTLFVPMQSLLTALAARKIAVSLDEEKAICRTFELLDAAVNDPASPQSLDSLTQLKHAVSQWLQRHHISLPTSRKASTESQATLPPFLAHPTPINTPLLPSVRDILQPDFASGWLPSSSAPSSAQRPTMALEKVQLRPIQPSAPAKKLPYSSAKMDILYKDSNDESDDDFDRVKEEETVDAALLLSSLAQSASSPKKRKRGSASATEQTTQTRKNSSSSLSRQHTLPAKKRAKIVAPQPPTYSPQQQMQILEQQYAHNRYPAASTRLTIGQDIGLSARAVQTWFEARRARDMSSEEEEYEEEECGRVAVPGGLKQQQQQQDQEGNESPVPSLSTLLGAIPLASHAPTTAHNRTQIVA